MIDNFTKIKERLENIKMHIKEKCAEKSEIPRLEKTITHWCKQSFASMDVLDEKIKTDSTRLENIEE